MKKKKMMKTNFILGIILFSTGIILEFGNGLSSIFDGSLTGLNLSMNEVDTVYSDTIDPLSNDATYIQDTAWKFPATTNYYISSSYSSYHPAIDIVPTDGNYEIYAASSGYIVTSSYKWDGGNYLVLKQDNGYYSLYCHLSSKAVNEGDRVNKGQVIGTMGKTGIATGVHLHFSIWSGYPYQHSKSINPLNFY